MRILSWNVNGIRAALNKGLLDWFRAEKAEVVCFQEVKATQEQTNGVFDAFPEYKTEWDSAKTKAGYSGVASLARIPYTLISNGFGIEEFDREGRIIIQEFEHFFLYNIYFPNGTSGDERLDYKMRFYDAFLDHVQELRKKGKAVIICGDYNTAHKAIDLRNPKSNEKNSGFLPIERAWMDKLVDHGWVDTFRMFHPDEPDHYTWWTYRMGARKRNVGWRIDYFFIDDEHKGMLMDAFIQSDVMGSDHCPLGIQLQK
jgi:exodeoxyribonuclease-3